MTAAWFALLAAALFATRALLRHARRHGWENTVESIVYPELKTFGEPPSHVRLVDPPSVFDRDPSYRRVHSDESFRTWLRGGAS